MAKQDFTLYLGKKVDFLNPVNYFGTGFEAFERVTGEIDGIVLFKSGLSETEFFVRDNTYRFSDVIFISELDNPVRV